MDGGELARILRQDVLGSLENDPAFTITDVPTEAAARTAVEDGAADAAFIVPPGFTMAISAGQAVTLEVVGARDAGLGTEVARAIGPAVWRWGRDRAALGRHREGAGRRGCVSGSHVRPGARWADRRGGLDRGRAGPDRGRRHGPAPACPPDLLLGVDGRHVPVLLGPDGAGEPVRGTAARDPWAHPGRARPAVDRAGGQDARVVPRRPPPP